MLKDDLMKFTLDELNDIAVALGHGKPSDFRTMKKPDLAIFLANKKVSVTKAQKVLDGETPEAPPKVTTKKVVSEEAPSEPREAKRPSARRIFGFEPKN